MGAVVQGVCALRSLCVLCTLQCRRDPFNSELDGCAERTAVLLETHRRNDDKQIARMVHRVNDGRVEGGLKPSVASVLQSVRVITSVTRRVHTHT